MQNLHPGQSFGEDSNVIWNNMFGEQAWIIWRRFISEMRKQVQINDVDEKLIKEIIDGSNTEKVNHHKFVEFLKGFGPLKNCVANVNKIMRLEYFHSFLTLEESHKYLELEPVGTFLLRFSSSKPGGFVIDYVSIGEAPTDRYSEMPEKMLSPMDLKRIQMAMMGISVNDSPIETQPQQTVIISVLIESAFQGFRVKQNGQYISFPSVIDVMFHYRTGLTTPFSAVLTKELWFHGDLSGSEAKELLNGLDPGTFLVRFSSSSPGSFAAGFIDLKGKFVQVLIPKVQGGFTVDSKTGKIYSSLTELVEDYKALSVFKYPFRQEDITKKVPQIGSQRDFFA